VKDLQLVGGDLRPAGRGFATVDGGDYIRQRIGMALAEPYGSDPYHTTWGSVLDSYKGQPQLPGTPALVSSEVSRVIQQVIDAQQQQMKNYVLTGARSQFSAADVIASVDSVNAMTSPNPEIMQVSVALTTSSGSQVIITRTVTGG
jgi:hypothetical protein